MTAIVSSQSAHRNRGHSHPDHLTKCHNSFLTLEHCLILFDFFFSILWLFFIVVNGIERIILPHVVWFDLFRFFIFFIHFFSCLTIFIVGYCLILFDFFFNSFHFLWLFLSWLMVLSVEYCLMLFDSIYFDFLYLY